MDNPKKIRPDPNLRLMYQVRQVLRYHHSAFRTEQVYCDWIKRYILNHGAKAHPRKVDENLETVRAKRGPRQPVLMSQRAASMVLEHMTGLHLLMAKLLYCGGLGLMQCIRLRIRDLDSERKLIYVRTAKRAKAVSAFFLNDFIPSLKFRLKRPKGIILVRSPLDGLS